MGPDVAATRAPLPFEGTSARWAAPWALVALVVAAGIAAQVLRPLAPPVGPVPDAARWFDAAHLELVDAYWRPVYRAGLLSLLLRVGVPLLVALSPPGRRLVRRIVEAVGPDRPARAAAAVVLAIVIGTDLVLAPLAFWAGYLHEGAFGFRVQGFGGWARDWLVVRGPGWIAAGTLTLAGFWLARRMPRTWPLVAGLAGAGLTALLVFAAPVVLEPLRFSTIPLEDGPLREEVTAVVDRSGLQAERVLVADASRRTIRHNAYISGLGRTRRVVLYDTLVDERPVDEVAMVVAHELGHERNHDLARGTATGAAGAVLAALAIGLLVRWRVTTGRQRSVTDPTGVAAIVALVVVLNAVSLPVQNALSRRAEAAADLAALELTRDPETFVAMNRELSLRNLSDPGPPTWARALWSSHPSTAERLAMGERWPFDGGDMPWTPGHGSTDQEDR
jgi:STE24 endopeptidase